MLDYERQRSQGNVGVGSPRLVDVGDRHIRYGRTTANGGTYPASPANKFYVEFGELTWDDTTTGEEDATFAAYENPTLVRICYSDNGWLAEATIVLATLHHGRWHIVPFGGDNCDEVRFQIVSADPTTRTALGEIMARPVGCSDVPESTLGGTIIEICDPSGCYFNEPNVNLTGREGWAKRMMPVHENICQPDPNYLVPQWEVYALCCETPTCS